MFEGLSRLQSRKQGYDNKCNTYSTADCSVMKGTVPQTCWDTRGMCKYDIPGNYSTLSLTIGIVCGGIMLFR